MKLAILFDHFGPYHLARLRAAAQLDEAVGVEFAARSGEYAWDLADRNGLTITTMAAGTASLGRHLDSVAPEAVAVPGWSSQGALAALSWCLRRGVPAVVMSESTAHDERRSAWKEAVKRRVVRLFSAALAGGRSHVDYLRQLGMPGERISQGYDAIDNEHFAPNATTPRRGFLASARFIEKKNLAGLLRAYAAYRESQGSAVEPWPLTLLGDGPLRPQLEGVIAELGLREWVTLPGFKQYQELPGYYASAKAFIHASTTEQWGLVVNEAMAAGLPVLVSQRCGCAPDLVEEGRNGFAFDPFDPAAITNAMIKVASLPEEQREAMGQESRKIIAQWGPRRFADGLHAAAVCALKLGPRRPGPVDRLLLKLLMRR